MAKTRLLSWTERGRGKGVFEYSDALAVGMVISVGVEARVPPRLSIVRIGTIPVAVLSEIPIADMVVDPPPVICECPRSIVVRSKPAVAILERCLAIVPAGAVQGDRAVVALAVHCQGEGEALGAIRVQVAAGLAGKEMTGNHVGQWIIGGRAPNSPYNNTLHIVVVVCASSVAGLQRSIEPGACPLSPPSH
jgi:hypothetical protein